jgi:precorrin-6B methylase 1
MLSYLKTDTLPRVSAVSILAARIGVAFLTLDTHISSLANALVRKS